MLPNYAPIRHAVSAIADTVKRPDKSPQAFLCSSDIPSHCSPFSSVNKNSAKHTLMIAQEHYETY